MLYFSIQNASPRWDEEGLRGGGCEMTISCSGNISSKGPFSMAMLDYRSVDNALVSGKCTKHFHPNLKEILRQVEMA